VPALRELQESFVGALFDGSTEPLLAQIAANGLSVADRLDVYRNNLRAGFAKALAITFPVIERLVGAQYFRQLAEAFIHEHPSRAGNLHHIGAPFAGFLRKHFADTQYLYLADTGDLEWAHEESLVAADEDAINPDSLRNIASSAYPNIRFNLHPAVRLVRSDYPIVRIWSANQLDSSADEIIDLDSGGDNVLVLRTPDGIEFHRMPSGEFAALRAISAGFPLGTALEAALSVDSAFDLGQALHRFFRLKLFI
jgi:hypothetical protein